MRWTQSKTNFNSVRWAKLAKQKRRHLTSCTPFFFFLLLLPKGGAGREIVESDPIMPVPQSASLFSVCNPSLVKLKVIIYNYTSNLTH